MSAGAPGRGLHRVVEPTAGASVPAGPGNCAIWLQKSPTRDEHDPGQDAAAIVDRGAACALLVADGVGGHRGGARAAAVAIEQIAERVSQGEADGLAMQSEVLAGIESANEHLIGGGGSASTILVALVDGRELRCVHAGDSELLVVGQRGKIKHQTVSHSPVGYGVEAGLIDEADGLEHAERHVISSCVGMPGMRVEVASAIRLAARDTVVLGSDGLWDNLHVDEVVEIVRKGPLCGAIERLAQICQQRMRGEHEAVTGKPDDLSIVLFRLR